MRSCLLSDQFAPQPIHKTRCKDAFPKLHALILSLLKTSPLLVFPIAIELMPSKFRTTAPSRPLRFLPRQGVTKTAKNDIMGNLSVLLYWVSYKMPPTSVKGVSYLLETWGSAGPRLRNLLFGIYVEAEAEATVTTDDRRRKTALKEPAQVDIWYHDLRQSNAKLRQP